jgi:hypothetical protein
MTDSQPLSEEKMTFSQNFVYLHKFAVLKLYKFTSLYQANNKCYALSSLRQTNITYPGTDPLTGASIFLPAALSSRDILHHLQGQA